MKILMAILRFFRMTSRISVFCFHSRLFASIRVNSRLNFFMYHCSSESPGDEIAIDKSLHVPESVAVGDSRHCSGRHRTPWSVAVPSGPVAADIASLIEKSRAEWNVPGLSVAIVKDGQIFLSSGFGVREFGKAEAVDGDTLFAIASNSKAFTAAAIAMLDEEGKLKWSDRVQQHLPWLELYDRYVSTELRVDDLLCHRSGLGTFSGDLLWWGTPYSPEDVLRRARQLSAKGPFRASYGYSNLMYLAAGEVIQKASGQSWQSFIEQRILQPVGMDRSVTSIKALDAKGNFATPHKSLVDGVRTIPWYNWDTMAAAGGIISSSNDMAKWVRVQLDRGRIDDSRRLFSEASSFRMWSSHTIVP